MIYDFLKDQKNVLITSGKKRMLIDSHSGNWGNTNSGPLADSFLVLQTVNVFVS